MSDYPSNIFDCVECDVRVDGVKHDRVAAGTYWISRLIPCGHVVVTPA